MKKQNIKNFKNHVLQQNLKKKNKSVLTNEKFFMFSEFETLEKHKIKILTENLIKNLTQNQKDVSEKLVGIEISLSGRIKGAAMARRTTTGLSGSLKPQTILGSEYYSITQKNIFTKWGILGLTIRNNNKIQTNNDKKI